MISITIVTPDIPWQAICFTFSLTDTLEVFSGLFGIALIVPVLMKYNIIKPEKERRAGQPG